MINGLGVLGWGVGGIEAEAAMLGQPVSMLIPKVVGFKLTGELPAGATATDLVLTVTELLRKQGVVGKFVEFYGPASPTCRSRPRHDRQHEPGVRLDLRDLPGRRRDADLPALTGRPDETVALVEAYAKAQGLWHDPIAEPRYSERVELDLSTVVPSLAGPARPRTGCRSTEAKAMFREALGAYLEHARRSSGTATARRPAGRPSRRCRHRQRRGSAESFPASDPPARAWRASPRGEPDTSRAPTREARRPDAAVAVDVAGGHYEVDHGHVVIAAITSCTNTSNPDVMMAAGLLARNAVARGLTTKPWVKASLAPGSRVVTDYLDRARLTSHLEALRFHLVGYGCTTCIGNSGPLDPPISQAIAEHDLSVAAVLSGNRNFEGRINPDVRMNYLASPPLVVAYALAGTLDWDPYAEPFPAPTCASPTCGRAWRRSRGGGGGSGTEMSRPATPRCSRGTSAWRALPVATGERFAWDESSTYVRSRRSSRGWRASRCRCTTSSVPGSSPCSATASPPTTSRPPAHRASSPAGAGCRSTAWRRATSAPTAHARATTR
jgi:aconitate hydratase